MADLDELKIPMAMRAAAEAIIVLTDEVCADLLDEEYASLAGRAVAKLAQGQASSSPRLAHVPLRPHPLTERWPAQPPRCDIVAVLTATMSHRGG